MNLLSEIEYYKRKLNSAKFKGDKYEQEFYNGVLVGLKTAEIIIKNKHE